MNPQGPISTTIPESKRANNFNIFESVSRASDISYRGFTWHGKMKSESENIVKNLKRRKMFKNTKRKNNSEVEKVGRKKYLIWNHTNLILNWNKKVSKMIHVDTNNTEPNQPITTDSTNTGSIHDSTNNSEIKNILESLVNSPVHASPIFFYGGASEPASPSHDSSA